MIAADSSSLIAYIQGEKGADITLLDAALAAGQAVLPPVVLTEVLSDPLIPNPHEVLLDSLRILEIGDGYWRRAAKLRAILKSQNLRATMADALIAQSCIDHNVVLITRDSDFRHFAKHCGLKLA
jgi:predicted nucleic acid-binding protein